MPIKSSLNGLPVGPITVAPLLHAPPGQRDVGGDDDVGRPSAIHDPVVGDIGAFGTVTRSIMSLRGTFIKALATT